MMTTAKKAEAVTQTCSFLKKMFLEISQNSQESTCARVSFLIKFQPEACNFIKKETNSTGVFPVFLYRRFTTAMFIEFSKLK